MINDFPILNKEIFQLSMLKTECYFFRPLSLESIANFPNGRDYSSNGVLRQLECETQVPITIECRTSRFKPRDSKSRSI